MRSVIRRIRNQFSSLKHQEFRVTRFDQNLLMPVGTLFYYAKPRVTLFMVVDARRVVEPQGQWVSAQDFPELVEAVLVKKDWPVSIFNGKYQLPDFRGKLNDKS